MRIAVWPSVETHGELDSAESEWLHTNGAGAYAMSTLALMHTRRFHGLLVAALDPPLERHVVISHADTALEVGRRVYKLSTHQFPEVAPTPGYRLLETFAQDPLPRWVFRIGKSRLERRLCLARGKNVLVVSYTWFGRSPVRLTVKPLLPMRPIHDLRSEHGGFIQKVSLRPQQVKIQPVRELPCVTFGYQGLFMGSPDWWRRFEYPEDMRRHVHYQEDLWTPGTFELTLEPDKPAYIIAGLGELPEESAESLMAETQQALMRLDPGTEHSVAVRALSVAAEQFRAPLVSHPTVIAGYPWLGPRQRDTLLSLPGLYLVPGLLEEAKAVLRTAIRERCDQLLQSYTPESFLPAPSPSVDASLWLFEAVCLLAKELPQDDPFVLQEVYPVLVEIFERVHRSPPSLVWLTNDGLLAIRNAEEPLTWMDSRSKGAVVTPRQGLAVEFQALWCKACSILQEYAEKAEDSALAQRALAARERAREAFRTRFWCQEVGYPYDVIDDVTGDADAAIRPNAVIALAVEPELFENWQADAILERAREKLLTSRGLRTLDPDHPAYVGYYEGGMEERRAAYHQGVVWGYLIGFLARAALQRSPDDFELQVDVRDWVLRVVENGTVLGQVAQVASGDEPHHAGGCPAQAWNVAEALRTLQQDLGL